MFSYIHIQGDETWSLASKNQQLTHGNTNKQTGEVTPCYGVYTDNNTNNSNNNNNSSSGSYSDTSLHHLATFDVQVDADND